MSDKHVVQLPDGRLVGPFHSRADALHWVLKNHPDNRSDFTVIPLYSEAEVQP